MSDKLLDVLLSNSIGQSRSYTAIDTSDPSRFNAAAAAIDRAIQEKRAAAAAEVAQIQAERRNAQQDRRQGLPDTRAPGSPERRTGIDRRLNVQQGFGRRGTTG